MLFQQVWGRVRLSPFLTSSLMLLKLLVHRIIFNSKVFKLFNALLSAFLSKLPFSTIIFKSLRIYSDKKGLLTMISIKLTRNLNLCWPLYLLLAVLNFVFERKPSRALSVLCLVAWLPEWLNGTWTPILRLQHTVFLLYTHILLFSSWKHNSRVNEGFQPWSETTSELPKLPV